MKKLFATLAIATGLIANHALADSFLQLKELSALPTKSRGLCYYFKENTYDEITAEVVDENSDEYKMYFEIDRELVILKGENVDTNDEDLLDAWRFTYKNYNIFIRQEKIINDKLILNTLTITGNGKTKKMNVIQFCPNGRPM